ncbi:GNAT family N-acetyltransferase [Agarivorans aestuarii]|uniref:GNAT family N-acetyltransferase n=1 Tax=Agarivorans aestuarii TaxID=1563703 RepID=A0ABU7G034_9ALTE|nr:GNAT family N-acetyltransferase [Agarivorans aestuarii]MEE1672720.1 GNAT family N-acetyltransferase [Agarivorans aestuarii]
MTTVYYLQQTQLEQLNAKPLSEQITIEEIETNQAKLSRQFYAEVGKHWQWTDKLVWTEQQWLEYTSPASLRTFSAYLNQEFVGYFELNKHPDNSVEIAYFGLAKAFHGQGIGGGLLSQCIQRAWQWNPSRVWVHTCDLDHPAALANYKARGMALYKTEHEE